jgi:hypothetical protein
MRGQDEGTDAFIVRQLRHAMLSLGGQMKMRLCPLFRPSPLGQLSGSPTPRVKAN